MSAKRALIVDDSRAARVILSRMLETHGLDVDTVESGEQALDYLRSAQPDVVFMDHLMPGMDGFEAIRAMKANTQTATIPVMMYTSQEGEHYLQEAHKVGAMGVLSKTLKPSEVARALYELHLLSDRRELRREELLDAANVERTESRTSAAHASIAPMQRPFVADTKTASTFADATSAPPLHQMRAAVTTLFNEQQIGMQQLLQSSLDAMSNRLSAELRTAAQQVAMSSSAVAPDEIETNRNRGWFAVALIVVALIPTAVIAALYWRVLNDNQAQLEQSTSQLAMIVTEQQTQIEQLRAELRKRQDAAGEISVATPNKEEVLVPYGELPLTGERVRRLRAMLDHLQAEGFRGRVRVASFVGDFCLIGSASTGYKLARDELSFRRCDLIGNPFEDGLTAAQRQLPESSSLVAGADTKVQIDLRAEGRKPAVGYPPQTDKLTAGEWNRVAVRNNRVEFSAVSADHQMTTPP